MNERYADFGPTLDCECHANCNRRISTTERMAC